MSNAVALTCPWTYWRGAPCLLAAAHTGDHRFGEAPSQAACILTAAQIFKVRDRVVAELDVLTRVFVLQTVKQKWTMARVDGLMATLEALATIEAGLVS